VCETIRRHVLALEANHVAFCEAILPLVKKVELQQIEKPGYSLDLDSPPKKKIKRVLDCE
jgi:hypothetical protein